ncbi:MAG: histone H1-like repetitive region-containing protein [Treponema sp.]|jgi:hypothetical protein|nr:histone H1-like repetitive region-containing protein [Treponema sp.]
MAPVKKPAAKKPAAKKPAAKKPAAKKPAAKKPAAKKPVAKKPAVKKPAAKKPAVKKPAAKKSEVKKPVKKTIEKKPAVKAVKKEAAEKPAVKKPAEVKPVATVEAVTKPAEKKPASGKSAPAKPSESKSVEALDPNIKFRNLFDAFALGKLPFAQGYIISSFFHPATAYSIYEVVSYAGVKEIFVTDTGLQFITGGKKLYVLVEPDTYHQKPVEPVSRAEGERIPKRFNELETIIAKNQTRIMVSKDPNETYGSFTILKPQGVNFAVIFYDLPDLFSSIAAFFEDSLNKQRRVPQSDARKAAQLISSIIEKSMGFKGEFE